MNNFELTKNDTLIINGIPITRFKPEDIVCSLGNNTNHYCLDIEVESDSKADSLLKELIKGKTDE